MTRTRRTAMLAAAAALLVACGSARGDANPSGGSRTVTVFAAASLTDAFGSIARDFEADHPGSTVRLSFGGSSGLAQQVVQGAPVDVFASANPATMQQVVDAGLADAQPEVFVRNVLQIAVPADNAADVATVADLADHDVKVALCDRQVPCGAAAETALHAAGVEVQPVTLEQDVKAVLTKVELGEVDAGLVYRSDVVSAGGKVDGIAFPEAERAVNDYPIATMRDSGAPALARQFVDAVGSTRGRRVLARAGFRLP